MRSQSQQRFLPIGVLDKTYEIQGGPFRQAPADKFRVKMAAEIDADHEVSIPTEDFSVPDQDLMIDGIRQTLEALRDGRQVYVGCMGGIGRTGLFMACLAKAMGVDDPVAYVRRYYLGHAVETEGQQKYVRDFPTAWAREWLLARWEQEHPVPVPEPVMVQVPVLVEPPPAPSWTDKARAFLRRFRLA